MKYQCVILVDSMLSDIDKFNSNGKKKEKKKIGDKIQVKKKRNFFYFWFSISSNWRKQKEKDEEKKKLFSMLSVLLFIKLSFLYTENNIFCLFL